MSLALEMADFWLAGNWLPSGYPAAITVPGDQLRDIYGQTLTVGSLVKFIGTVTAMDPLNPHFQDIEVQAYFPKSSLVEPETGLFPTNVPAPSQKYKFHPLQLMKFTSNF